jgi:hypothetical protein
VLVVGTQCTAWSLLRLQVSTFGWSDMLLLLLGGSKKQVLSSNLPIKNCYKRFLSLKNNQTCFWIEVAQILHF